MLNFTPQYAQLGPMSMGRPPRKSAAEVCRAVALHPEPVVTAKDIHKALDMSADGALDRLQKLETQGFVKSKQPGSSALVFWLTDKGKAELNDVL